MDTAIYHTFKKTIGDTTYIVEYAMGKNARETAGEKLRKLILNNLSSIQTRSLKTKLPMPDITTAS